MLKQYREIRDAAIARTAGSTGAGQLFLGESLKPNRRVTSRMEHLACFVPGMLALEWHMGGQEQEYVHGKSNALELAEEYMATCMMMYELTPTGLSAEAYDMPMSRVERINPQKGFKFSLLRPETIESAFVLWRVTKKQEYRDFGWKVFNSIEKWARLPGEGGYTAIHDVLFETDAGKSNRLDRMDSFFLSETLKYLYLLFSPDSVLPLDEYVLNTEAHPLPIWE